MQAVLFDCDGVLINSELLIDRAQEAVLARYGMAYTARQFMEHFTGLSRERRYAQFAEEYQRLHGEVMPASVVRELEDACNDFMARLMAVPEGMAAMLDRLRAAGIPCAVASNSTQDRLEAKLRQVGLYDAFAPHIYGIDHVSRPKPEPDIYHYAAAQLGVDAADCVIVEDSLVGLAAGLAAGGHVIGFAANYADPAFALTLLEAAGADEAVLTMPALADRVASLLDLPPVLPAAALPPAPVPAPRPPQP